MADTPLPLLNVFEVELDGHRRHLICFLETVLAGASGIDDRSVIGEFEPGPDGEFRLESFRPNPSFIAAFVEFMNAVALQDPALESQAGLHSGGHLSLLDPRYPPDAASEIPDDQVVGHVSIDPEGRVVPGSFQYNPAHQWFSAAWGTSGMLEDQTFYDWLHAMEGKG